jgi:probable F420-dependent oxidoreductase
MKFGLSLCPEVGRHRETREQARAAEALGYDSLWLPEHHLMEGYSPSPFLGLAEISAITERVTIGSNVALVPFYHPVRLAEDAGMLADMSAGRFVLGVGLGYRPEEFAAFGVPYKQRGRRMQEGLTVVRKLLENENVTFSGDYVELADVTVYPRPADPIPIWVGGWSEPALRRAAELGDAWFPGPTADLDKLRWCLDVYDTELDERGRRRQELPIFRETWVAKDSELFETGISPMRNLYVTDYISWNQQNVHVDGSGDPFDELRRDRFVVGDPDEVTEEILRYEKELGITHFIARMHFHGSDHEAVLKSMEIFADEVIPVVKSRLGDSA